MGLVRFVLISLMFIVVLTVLITRIGQGVADGDWERVALRVTLLVLLVPVALLGLNLSAVRKK